MDFLIQVSNNIFIYLFYLCIVLSHIIHCLSFALGGFPSPVSSSSSIKPNTIISTLAATITPLRSPCEPNTEECASTPPVRQSVSGDGFVMEDEDDDGCGGDEDRGGGVNRHDIQRDPNEEDLQGKTEEGTKWIFDLKSCNKQNRNGECIRGVGVVSLLLT